MGLGKGCPGASDPTSVSHRVPSYQVTHEQIPRLYDLSTATMNRKIPQWKGMTCVARKTVKVESQIPQKSPRSKDIGES